MTELSTYQQTLFNELHAAWLKLYQITIGLENTNVRKQLLFSMTNCLRWNRPEHLRAMKVTLETISTIASRELLSQAFYQYLERITELVSELSE